MVDTVTPLPRATPRLQQEHRSQLELILIGAALASTRHASLVTDQDVRPQADRLLSAIRDGDRKTMSDFLAARGVALTEDGTAIEAIALRLREDGRRDRVSRALQSAEFSVDHSETPQLREVLERALTILREDDD